VAIGDVMVLEKMNLHNPTKGYDTFVFSFFHFFFRINTALLSLVSRHRHNHCIADFAVNDHISHFCPI
jgi:hypothetical protein